MRDARLWNRFFDLYVQPPMQKIVADKSSPPASSDPHGVREARATIAMAYGMLEPSTPASPATWSGC